MGKSAKRAVPSEAMLARVIGLLRDLVDEDPCDYDHNDFCQTHYYGRPCAHERAKNLLSKVDSANARLDRQEEAR